MADSLDITAEEARRIVLNIARRKGNLPPQHRLTQDEEASEIIQSIREELGDVVESIATQIYSRQNRFLLELIQNSEDCKFTRTRDHPTISFEVSPENIIVECNEDGFTETHVRQICHTAKSWKRTTPGYIGEKGLGFKSVFQVASRVHIQSNSFSFSFKYNGEPESTAKLGIITPIPEDDIIPPSIRPLTRMTLVLNNRIPYDELLSHFVKVPHTLLLFLSTLKEIRVKMHDIDHTMTGTMTFRKSEEESGVTRLSRSFDALDTTDDSRYVIKKTLASGLPNDSARPGTNECEVVLAFPVEDGNHEWISGQYDVFAFLPVCAVGFKFLIQADFMLQASREEVMVDSPWNKAIIQHVARAFCQAMLDFCRRDSHRYYWVQYLPVGRAFESNQLWRGLSSKLVDLLKEQNILYNSPSDLIPKELHQPRNVRTLPSNFLDREGSPLFVDRPGVNGRYLSLAYEPDEIKILQTAFKIPEIDDLHLFHIIYEDLRSPRSKLKDPETDSDWHTRVADLIIYIMDRSPDIKTRIIDELALIPLSDEQWVAASAYGLVFPALVGPSIPSDILVTIQPRAAENASRREMFRLLGARSCPPEEVTEKLWRSYSRGREGASCMSASKAHLRYLFWHADTVDHRFSWLWIYDHTLREVKPYYKVIYMPSDDEYGPKELLRSVPNPRNPSRTVPECPVSFANDEYLDLFPTSIRRHDMLWSDWLEQVLGVRTVPRLKHGAGSLSQEIRHIIEYRPEKIVGTLKKYWSDYEQDMAYGSSIVDTISQSEVTCLDAPATWLSKTYFPLPTLVQRSQELGINGGFEFLSILNLSAEGIAHEDWRFLQRFGVEFEESMQFYVRILQHHEVCVHQAWNDGVRRAILKTYELVADEYRARDKDMLREVFHQDNLILHPRAFQRGSLAATWLDAQGCVWQGPENLIEKIPLAPSYRRNSKLAYLFQEILGIKNSNWRDYMETLLLLRRTQNQPSDNLYDKLKQLYKLLSKSRLNDEEWEMVINKFETERLIFAPSESAWFAPSRCLWTSPVPVQGKAIIGNSYPDELQLLFFERLKIAPAALSTIVEGLCSLAQGQPSLIEVKEMIWAINNMDPKQGDLDSMVECSILPVRVDQSGSGSVSFCNCRSNFVVTDRLKLGDIFCGHIGILDFSLEEVRQLNPFLQALDLDKRFLSRVCTERTACTEERVLDARLTTEFRDKAYDILRCVVSGRSPHVIGGPRSLHHRLLRTTILKSDGISTEYTIQLDNGDICGPITQDTGHLHIEEHDNAWQIIVPRNSHARAVSYSIALPDALTKLFNLGQTSRESISYVLNSSDLIIDDILEHAGIGLVPGIEPPPRRVAEDTSEDESQDGDPTSFEIEALPQVEFNPSLRASGENGASMTVSGPLETPSSGDFAEDQDSFYRQDLHPGNPSLAYFGGYGSHRENAYRELLDNVIRVARRIALPRSGDLTSPRNGQFHPNFDHEAAFGIRSQGEMNHDMKIGAAGELFVYECLLNLRLPSFGYDNWRSTIRKEVTIHPTYNNMGSWSGRETSDLVYRDNSGILTRFLIDGGYLDEGIWAGATPEYSIEVKTTTGGHSDRFFMSLNQYRMMNQMALRDRVSEKIYMICRVYNLGRETLDVKLYVDPDAHRNQALAFEAQSWTVTPRR